MSFGAFNPISGAGVDVSSLIDGGAIEIDGDKLSITYSPSNYTPNTGISEADSTDDLAAHLAGIDDIIVNVDGSRAFTGGITVQASGINADLYGDVRIGDDQAGGAAGSRTDATGSRGDVLLAHYTNAEQDILLFSGQALTSGGCSVLWGGGSSAFNTVTQHSFYTGATSTTLTGTERMRIDLAGNIVLGSGEQGATAATGATVRAPDVVAGGTDVAGADITIAAGLGTGAGDVGQIIFQTPRVLGSGTTQQSLTTLMTLDEATVRIVAGNLWLDQNTSIYLDGDEDQDTRIYTSGEDITFDRNGSTIFQLQGAGVICHQPLRANAAATVDLGQTTTPWDDCYVADQLVLGNSDDLTTASTGGTLRAPRTNTGGAGDIPGADLTIEGGRGTGVGDAGQIIFKTARVAAAGDNQQTMTNILVLDEALASFQGQTSNHSVTSGIICDDLEVNGELWIDVQARLATGAALQFASGSSVVITDDGSDGMVLRTASTARITIASGGNITVAAKMICNGDGTDVFQFAADATDPTSGGGAATGRIPVSIGGGTVYLAYY